MIALYSADPELYSADPEWLLANEQIRDPFAEDKDMTILELVLRALIMGVVATMTFDLWAILLQRLIGAPAPDWSLLGRWIGHFGEHKIMHDNIRQSAPVPQEQSIGWLTHYIVGTFFAAILLIAAGADWAHHPTLVPAIIAGLLTVVFVWFVLMPAFGQGIAMSKNPAASRIRLINIVSHLVLGIGFFIGAHLANQIVTI
jgi:Protein of unknown function (DUF2938)